MCIRDSRYSLSPYAGYPWTTVPAGLVTAADPMGTLLDPNFPPDPMAFAGNWLYGDGHPDLFTKNLVANLYDPSDSNPPSPPAYSCPTCTYQYSYKDPPTVDAAGFSAVAAAMPPQRDSGWARLHDGRQAISWTPLALDNALLGGGGPPTDGPILRMLSKYDPANNPAGFRMPDYGDYTPLTGSLRDAKEYLQTVMDADPYAGCGRSYYVMLLTDGEEHDVVGAA